MSNLKPCPSNALGHPGVREMYDYLQGMETKLPESYPLGTADRYLAVAQKNWEQNDLPSATAENDEDDLLVAEDDYLMSA